MEARSSSPLGRTNSVSASLFAAKRIGRPPVADPTSERSRKPWLDEDISERTYRRRKAAGTLKVRPPLHHAAHVAAWFATLDSMARLDHRSFVRECDREARKAARPEQSVGDLLKLYKAATRVLH